MNRKTASLVLAIALVNGISAQQPAGSDSSIAHAKKILLQTRMRKDTLGSLIPLRDLGIAFYLAKQYDSAILYFKEGLNLAISRRQYYLELHDFRPVLNNNFFLLGNYTAAMEISVDGLARAEALNNPERIAHFKGVIGYILMKQGKLVAAKQYFIDFLKLATGLHNKLLEDARAGGQRRCAVYPLHQRYHGEAKGHCPYHRRVSDRSHSGQQVDFRFEGRRCFLVRGGYRVGNRSYPYRVRTDGERCNPGDV